MTMNWEAEDSATPERVGMLIADFIQAMGLERGEHLIEEMKIFCVDEINKNSDLGSFYTIQDIGPKIWAFYQGYMACHKDWADKVDKLIGEVQPK